MAFGSTGKRSSAPPRVSTTRSKSSVHFTRRSNRTRQLHNDTSDQDEDAYDESPVDLEQSRREGETMHDSVASPFRQCDNASSDSESDSYSDQSQSATESDNEVTDENGASSPIAKRISLDNLTQVQRDLFHWYQRRITQFDKERAEYIARQQRQLGTVKQRHELKFALHEAEVRAQHLQQQTSDARIAEAQQRQFVLALQRENDALRNELAQQSAHVRSANVLKRRVDQDIVLQHDCRPNIVDRPKTTNLIQEQVLKGTGIENARSHEQLCSCGAQSQPQQRSSIQTRSNSASQVSKYRQSQIGTNTNTQPLRQSFGTRLSGQKPPSTGGIASRVLRTVFMPNDENSVLTQRVAQLEQQLHDAQSVYEQHITTLTHDRMQREVQHKQQMETHLGTIGELRDEMVELQHQIDRVNGEYAALRRDTSQNDQSQYERLVVASEENQSLMSELNEIRTSSSNAKRRMHRFLSIFKNQALSSEEDANIIKSQYVAAQELYEKRIEYLERRLATVQTKHRHLTGKQNRDIQGYGVDVRRMREHLKKNETLLEAMRHKFTKHAQQHADRQSKTDEELRVLRAKSQVALYELRQMSSCVSCRKTARLSTQSLQRKLNDCSNKAQELRQRNTLGEGGANSASKSSGVKPRSDRSPASGQSLHAQFSNVDDHVAQIDADLSRITARLQRERLGSTPTERSQATSPAHAHSS